MRRIALVRRLNEGIHGMRLVDRLPDRLGTRELAQLARLLRLRGEGLPTNLIDTVVPKIGLEVVADPLPTVEFPTDAIPVGLVRDLAGIEILRAAVERLRQ